LLSDLFFAIFKHNINDRCNALDAVVICFQICSLLYLNTTLTMTMLNELAL